MSDTSDPARSAISLLLQPVRLPRRAAGPHSNRADLHLPRSTGWLKAYYFGVARAIQALRLHEGKGVRFAGASAGSLVATALALDCDLDAVKTFAMACAAEVRSSLPKAFQLRGFLTRIIDQQLRPGAYQEVGGRVEVAVTRLPLGRVRYKHYSSNEELKSVLLASCCMSPVAGLPFKLHGGLVCDGGVTDFQPMPHGAHRDDVITVSAMYFSRADIRPSQYTPAWWGLFPPGPERLQQLYELGLRDAFAYFHRRGIVPSPAVPCFLHDATATCGCRLDLTVSPSAPASADSCQQHTPDALDDVVDLTGDSGRGARGTLRRPCSVQLDGSWVSDCDSDSDGDDVGNGSAKGAGAQSQYCLLPSSACGVAPKELKTVVAHGNFQYCAAATSLAAAEPQPVAAKSTSNQILDRLTVLLVTALRIAIFTLMYVELFVLGVFTFWRAAVVSVLSPRRAPRAWRDCALYFISALSLRLAVRTLPVVGKYVPINTPKLHRMSFFYRVGAHIL